MVPWARWLVGVTCVVPPLAVDVAAATTAPCPPLDAAAIVPADGVWLGASLDWDRDSVAGYAERLGHAPAVIVTFSRIPMSDQERGWFAGAVDQAAPVGAVVLLTLEPHDGLAAVDDSVASRLAEDVAAQTSRGVPVVVRFAHEMNGSWYAWGQQPEAYVAAFRRVAGAIHSGAPGAAMMWAPNYGGGYPFAGGPHQAAAGSADAALLDTDGDGSVTQADDPYAPYWPGTESVDWAGMSLYHWGSAYPWGENEVPEEHKFTDLLHGTYDGLNGDESAVPDFYAVYGEAMELPVAITETAALFAPGRGGADELQIKQAWWRQVYAADHAGALPWLKMINWFEHDKDEVEIGGRVDWTATTIDAVRDAYRAELPAWGRFAGSPRCA